MANRLNILAGHLQTATIVTNPTSQMVTGINVGQLPFKYTKNGKKLTSEQRKFYEENGFLVIKKLVSSDEIEKYRQRFMEICKRETFVPGMSLVRDVSICKEEFVPGQKAVTKINDFYADDVLFSYCELPEVLDYAECFTGPNILAMHTMLINKPPDTGKMTSRHPMHQDLHFFPFRPADGIVCSWTAMQTVNRQNGCLVVVPGSHKGELLAHSYPKWEGGVNKLYHGIHDYDPSQHRVHLEMETGDTVFFHPLLIHGSGTNRTNDFRKSISCHYASGDGHYIDCSNTTQQLVIDEFKEIGKKIGSVHQSISFSDSWKLKTRIVRGDDNMSYTD